MENKNDKDQTSLTAKVLEYYQSHSQNAELPKYFCGVQNLPGRSLYENRLEIANLPVICIEDAEPVRNSSPTSSLASNRKLEWDNGADIGYHNCEKLQKSTSMPVLPTHGLTGRDSESLSTKTVEAAGKNYEDVLRYLQVKVGLPVAESTPCDRVLMQKSDPEIYDTPCTSKSKLKKSEIPTQSKTREKIEEKMHDLELNVVFSCQHEDNSSFSASNKSDKRNLKELLLMLNEKLKSKEASNIKCEKALQTTSFHYELGTNALDIDTASEKGVKETGIASSDSKETSSSKADISSHIDNPSSSSSNTGNSAQIERIASSTELSSSHVDEVSLPTETDSTPSKKENEIAFLLNEEVASCSSRNEQVTSSIKSDEIVHTDPLIPNLLQTTSFHFELNNPISGNLNNPVKLGSDISQKLDLDSNNYVNKYCSIKTSSLELTKPVVVECIDSTKLRDQEMQTNGDNGSVSLLTKIKSSYNKKSHDVIYTYHFYETDNKSTSMSTQTPSDIAFSNCNSFEYLYGSAVENKTDSKTNSSKSLPNTTKSHPDCIPQSAEIHTKLKRSSVKTDLTNISSDKSSNGHYLSDLIAHKDLANDIDKGLKLLQKLMKSKRYDEKTKEYYVRKIVKKLIKNNSDEDSSVSSEKITPNIDNKVPYHESFNYSSNENVKYSDDSLKSRQNRLNSNIAWVPAVPESSKPKVKDVKLTLPHTSSTDVSSDYYVQDFVLPQKSWKDDKTLSEKRWEKNLSSGDSRESDQLLTFARRERENQLSWINNEIAHLGKLKKILEYKEKNVPAKKSTAVYMITTERKDKMESPQNYHIQSSLGKKTDNYSEIDFRLHNDMGSRDYKFREILTKVNHKGQIDSVIDINSRESGTYFKVTHDNAEAGPSASNSGCLCPKPDNGKKLDTKILKNDAKSKTAGTAFESYTVGTRKQSTSSSSRTKEHQTQTSKFAPILISENNTLKTLDIDKAKIISSSVTANNVRRVVLEVPVEQDANIAIIAPQPNERRSSIVDSERSDIEKVFKSVTMRNGTDGKRNDNMPDSKKQFVGTNTIIEENQRINEEIWWKNNGNGNKDESDKSVGKEIYSKTAYESYEYLQDKTDNGSKTYEGVSSGFVETSQNNPQDKRNKENLKDEDTSKSDSKISKGVQTTNAKDIKASTSNSSSSSSSISTYICSCCKKLITPSDSSLAINSEVFNEASPFCDTCFTARMDHLKFAKLPPSSCNCFTMVNRHAIEKIKATLRELQELDTKMEYCKCMDQKTNKKQPNGCSVCGGKVKGRESIAYVLKFEPGEYVEESVPRNQRVLEEVKIDKIPGFKKVVQESVDSHRKHKHSKRKSKKTLQDYLESNRPDFVKAAEERRKCMIELAYMREQRCQKYKQLLALTNGIPMQNNYCSNNYQPNRVFTTREMKSITAKNYKKLPEVQQRLSDNRDKQIKKANRMLADIFNKKLREHVLQGRTALSTSTGVINLM